MSRDSSNAYSVDIDVKLPADSVSEAELGLIRMHLGDLINKTFSTTQKER